MAKLFKFFFYCKIIRIVLTEWLFRFFFLNIDKSQFLLIFLYIPYLKIYLIVALR